MDANWTLTGKKSLRLAAAILLTSALPACETFNDKPPSQPTDRTGRVFQPRVGMTKAEVVSAYGYPTRSTMTGRGEIWTYWTNKPGMFGISLGGEPKTAGFVFDPNGYVIDFHITQ